MFPYWQRPPQSPYQWQSTDWQTNNFLNQQNTPQQYTVTREVPPVPTQSQLPNYGYPQQSQQMNPGTPPTAPTQDYGRIAGSPNSTNGKNISITLNLNLGDGDNDEDDQGNNGYPNASYGMNPVQGYQAPSWYQ
jgi:hypothetical protein